MPRSPDIVGFGRGRSVDQRGRLRQEIDESGHEKLEDDQEHGEKEILFARGLELFGRGLDRDDFQTGDNFASAYNHIIEVLDPKLLAELDFWERIFAQYEKCISAVGVFAALPHHIQDNPDIQAYFFSRPHFNTPYLPRTVMERVDADLVVPKWLELGVSEHTFSQAPWKHFDQDQKRQYVTTALEASIPIRVLDGTRREFIDAIPKDEWNGIARERYQADPDAIAVLVKDDFDRATELFSMEDLRTSLERPVERWGAVGIAAPPQFAGLSLPLLRRLGFEEDKIDTWKSIVAQPNSNLDSGFHDFEKMTSADRDWILGQLETRAQVLDAGYQAFVGETLPKLLRKLAPAAVEKTLETLQPLLREWNLPTRDVADGILKPTIESQGASAFRTYEILAERVDCFDAGDITLLNLLCPNKESAKVLRNLMSKTGARFQDFMAFYLDTRFGRDRAGVLKGAGVPLSDEKNIVIYIDSRLPWTPPYFREFETRIASGKNSRVVAEELGREVQTQIQQIQAGKWPEDGLDDNKLGLLSHVFPPALGVSRNEYARLVRRREDRQDDIPVEWDALQGKIISFPVGKWELQADAQFETAPWSRLSEVVADVNGRKIIPEDRETQQTNELVLGPNRIIEIGREFARILTDNSASATKNALRNGYAVFLLRGGSKLPEFVSGREEAVRVFEWSKDALRDTVDHALRMYREANAASFDDDIAQATKREVPPRAKRGIVKGILGILKHETMAREEKSQRIRTILATAGVALEGDIVGQLQPTGDQSVLTEEGITLSLDQLLAGAQTKTAEAGKLSSIIVQKLLGAEAETMEKELDKWTFVEGAEGGEQRTIRFEITKRKLHAVAGLNSGVCVAVDDQLWNKPDFANVVMFADDDIAHGGMHFEIVQDGGKKYLSLPGINPSLTLLREVDPQRVIQMMLEYAKACAKAIGAIGVLIPTNTIILSNREELHPIVKELKLPTHSLTQPHQFSYSPFAYSWQDGYFVKAA
ncbi:MAG: hypothetical protein HYV33_03175 [Candidatus Kerfeldbacteria bacterium]|nr:hypothetical protein [Candidatus Kerfeldbacteria bacterium]